MYKGVNNKNRLIIVQCLIGHRGGSISLRLFSCGSSIPVELEVGDVFNIHVGRKTGEPGEKPSERGESQQEIQPTYSPGSGSNPSDRID